MLFTSFDEFRSLGSFLIVDGGLPSSPLVAMNIYACAVITVVLLAVLLLYLRISSVNVCWVPPPASQLNLILCSLEM